MQQLLVDILKQMNIRNKRIVLSITFMVAALAIFAQQTGINSPYGRYGYGLLSTPSIGASESMGGISYGLRRSQQVNPGNPASYSGIDSLTMVFDLGISGHLARLGDGVNSRDFYNGNLDYVAMQFPLFRNVGASFGLLPYSKVGYNFQATRSVSDIIYQETYRGTGGLSQIYGGLAWQPVKAISVGANVSYLFGNFSYSNVVTPVTSTGALVGETKNKYSIHNVKMDFGVQFIQTLDDDRRSVTLGAVYTPQVRSSAVVYPTEMMYTSDPYQTPTLSPTQILRTDTLDAQNFHLPHSFGLGVTYMTDKFLVGVDGTYQLWKNVAYPSVLDGMTDDNRFNNAFKVNAGAEYVIDPMNRNFFKRIRFRGGFSYANSYANMNVYNPGNGQRVGVGGYNEFGITAGLGLPIRDNFSGRVSILNIGFGYSRQQPELDYMIKQDMFKISINMNINELWFYKRRFN